MILKLKKKLKVIFKITFLNNLKIQLVKIKLKFSKIKIKKIKI